MRYCPYLGAETAEDFNKEHVIPDALGGADAFCIEVSKSMNTKGHENIETKFVHDYSMQRSKTECNIISRSGQAPSYRVSGKYEDGTKVTVSFDSESNQKIIPSKPVEVVESPLSEGMTNRQVKILLSDSDPNYKNLLKIEAANSKRGEIISRSEGEVAGNIQTDMPIDRTALIRGFAKIAFAACCFKFPGWAKSAHAANFRKVLQDSWSPKPQNWGVKWKWMKAEDAEQVLFPDIEERQHVIFLYGTPSGTLLCGVKLFGGNPVVKKDRKTAFFEMHDNSVVFLKDAQRWFALCDAPSHGVKFVEDELRRPVGD